MRTYLKLGSHNIVCDVCGFRFKVEDTRKRWDGLQVCNEDYERDHPQKYIRVEAERSLSVEPVREEPEDHFNYICYIYGANAFADLGEADCIRADIIVPSYTLLYNLKNAGVNN